MRSLTELAAAADPGLAEYALPDPGPGRFGGSRRELVLEAVYEGYLMHYGEPRAFGGMDADLRLLAGDALYALGLERLAEAGEVGAVAELADLITGCARAHAEGRTRDAEELWGSADARLAQPR